MAYDYTLPDGSRIRVPDGTSLSTAESWARRDFPELYKSAEAPTKQKEGFFANVGKGWKGLAANNSLGIGAFGDEQAARDTRRAVAKEEEAVKTTSWEDVKAADGIGNTLSTAGAFARDSLAGTLPYMAQTALGAKAGSMAGATLGPAGALVGGAAGAVAANLPALFGANLARQDQENPNAPLNKTAAAAAAVPQAALDAASTVFLFGRALGVNKLAGEAINKLVTKSAAEVEAKLVASAQQSLLKAGAKGAATGAVVEMPTELAQTVLERWQAGLALTGADANKEYEATLAGAAAVGGTLGPAHAIQARNAAQATLKERDQVTADAARADALQKDEAEKQKQAEYRKTPEYLIELDQKNAAYEKELRDLMAQRAALGKPLAGTSEAAQAAALGEQIKALRAGNKELTAEHAKNKSAITHAKIDPQEAWAAGAVAEPTVYAGGPRTKDEFSALREKIEGQKAAVAEDNGVDQYIATQADAARNYVNGLPDKPIADADVNDYVEHILADPAQAAAALNAKVRVPGATPKQNNAIWGLVKMQLAEQAAQAKKAAEEQTRIQAQNDARDQSELDLATQATNATQETDPLATFKESLPEPVKEEPEQGDIIAALGLRDDGTVQPGYLDNIIEKALGEGNKTERTVAIPEGVRPLAKAPSVFQHLDDLYAEREAADKAMGVAVASKNSDAQVEAAQNRERLSTTISRLVDSSPIVGGVVAARKEQDAAMADAATLLDDLNANRVLGAKNADARGSASSTPETLMNLVSKARQAFVQAVIKEAAITRAAFGKALTEKEALRTAGEIQRVFNEWMTRAAALPRKAVEEDRMVSPAQMRGTEIVKGAEYEKVDPRPLRERKLAAFGPASEVLQEQIRKEVGKLTSVPDQSFRVEQPLKTQFAPTEAAKVAEARGETAQTRGGELRRRREYVTNLIDRALQTRGMLPAVKSALERAAQAIESGKGSTDVVSGIENNRFSAGLLDSAEELARRVLDGSAKKTNAPRLIAEIDAALKDTAPAEGQGDLFDAAPQIEAQAAAKERIQKLEAQVAELRAGKFKSLKEGVSAGKRITDLEKAIALLQGDKKDRLDTAARDAKKEQARLDGDIAYTRATAANFAKAPEVVAGRKSVETTREIKAELSRITAETEAVRRRIDDIDARLTDFNWIKEAGDVEIDATRTAEQAALKAEKGAIAAPAVVRGPKNTTELAQDKIRNQLRAIRGAYQEAISRSLKNLKNAALTPELQAKQEEAQIALEGAFKWLKELRAQAVQIGEETKAKIQPVAQRIAFEKGTPAADATEKALTRVIKSANAEAKAEKEALQARIDLEVERIDRAAAELADVREQIRAGWDAAKVNLDASTDAAVRVEKLNLDYYANQLREQGFIVDTEKGTVTHPRQVSSSSQEAELRRQKEALAQAEEKRTDYAAEATALRTQQEGLGLGGTRNSVTTDRYGRRIVKTERIEPITERDERLRAEREERARQDSEEIAARQEGFRKERKQHEAAISKLTKEADAKRAEIATAPTKREKKPLEKALALILESLSAAKLALSSVGKSRTFRQQPLMKEARPIPTTMRTGSPESAAVTNAARASEGKLSAREQEALDSERATAIWKKGEENFTPADTEALREIKRRRLERDVASMPKKAKKEDAVAFDEPEAGMGSHKRVGSKVQSAFDGDYESEVFAPQDEGVQPDLTVGQIKAAKAHPLNKMSHSEAAQWLAERIKNPLKKALAARIAHFLKNSKGTIEFSAEFDDKGPGSYNNYQKRVTLSPRIVNDEAALADVLLHELTHAATMAGMRLNPMLRAQMGKLVEHVSKWLETTEGKAYAEAHPELLTNGEIYGLKNIDEFVAETFSSSAFQQLLNQIPEQKISALERFVRFLGRLFGANTPAEIKTLESVLKLSEKAMKETRRANEGGIGRLEGSAGMYIGESANMPEPMRILGEKAKALLAKGMSKEAIWDKTGWFQSGDGKWRVEISDEDVAATPEFVDALAMNTVGTHKLSDLLAADRLYNAYPALKNMTVELYSDKSDRSLGSFSKSANTAKINLAGAKTVADIEETLLHEIQHYVQDVEGFSSGTNSTATYLNLSEPESARKAAAAFTNKNMPKKAALMNRVADLMEEINAEQKEAEKASAMQRKEAEKKYEALIEKQKAQQKTRPTHPKMPDFPGIDASDAVYAAYEAEVEKYKSAAAVYKSEMDAYEKSADALRLDIKEAHNEVMRVITNAYSNVTKKYNSRKDALWDAAQKEEPYLKLLAAEVLYENKHGELEARDTTARKNLTAAERRATTPYKSTGVQADEVVYAPKRQYTNSDLEDAVGVMVGGRKDKLAEIRAHATGLEFRTRFIDAYAGIKEALKAGDPTKAVQVTYDLMNFAQRNHFVQQAVMHGTPTRAWWGKLHGKDTFKTEVQEGASLKNVSDMLGKVTGFGNAQATSDAFTLYALAKRAQTDGWDRVFADLPVPLKAGPAQAAEIEKENARRQKARAYADTLANDKDSPFKLAYKEYQDWNKGMLQFAQQAGIISEEEFRRLAAKQNYTPLFRADKFGNMVLEIDQGRDITVGRLADEPHMQKMLGGSGQVMDFFTASVRNASVIIDASLHNIASREAAMSLYAMGAAHPVSATEKGDNIVEFRGPDKDGKVDLQRFAVDTAGSAAGHIPTELLVKGFAGVPASLPGFVRMMGVPAQVLRKAVTRNPLYMVRQLIRDPMSAYLTTGAKFNPVTDTLSEISKALQGTADRTLDRRGITGGALFAENETDLERLQNEAKNNGNWWNIGYYTAALDHGAHAADAITRRNVYNGAIKEGASEIEATLAAYESMPFSKRGTSPSARYLNHMIPFLSAMIQGWDVMYRAMRGDMPLNERVDVRNKLLGRGAMIAGITMMYAMANADDEDYKKANTSERLNNWFVRIPGMDNALKVPIPFELGIIFKMIPEAMVRVAMSDKDVGQEARDIGAALTNMAPNLLMPQAMLPVTEAMLNRSFFTGRDIEGRALQNVDIGQRYDKNTSELSKALGFDFDLFGTQVGVSPKMLEYMASQYTGGLYGALAAVVDNVLPAGDKEKPDRTLAQLPLFKTVLLQEDAGGEVNRLYDKIEKFTRTEATFKKMLAEGDGEGAKRYVEDNREDFGKAKVASAAKAVLDKFSTMEKAVMAADWDGAKKKAALDNLKRIKSSLAEKYAAAL